MRQQYGEPRAGHQLTLHSAAKHLHLAFKDCTTSDEVYDTLVAVFLDVAGHYDPHYTKKTEEVCNYIETQPADQLITLEQLAGVVAFDPVGCVRVLVRHGYLQSVSGPRKKIQGYRRGPKWPAPKSFFEAGPVGFAYFLTKWFQFYLQAYIQKQMVQLESKEHIMQLDHIQSSNVDDEGWSIGGLPHAHGNWVDQRGVRWAADVSMLMQRMTLDLSDYDRRVVRGPVFEPPAELNRDVKSILSTATQAVACGGKHIATFTITHADRNSISTSCIVPV